MEVFVYLLGLAFMTVACFAAGYWVAMARMPKVLARMTEYERKALGSKVAEERNKR